MITNVIKLIQSGDWFSVSEEVEIAKGKYEMADSIKKIKRKVKRQWLAKNIQSK